MLDLKIFTIYDGLHHNPAEMCHNCPTGPDAHAKAVPVDRFLVEKTCDYCGWGYTDLEVFGQECGDSSYLADLISVHTWLTDPAPTLDQSYQVRMAVAEFDIADVFAPANAMVAAHAKQIASFLLDQTARLAAERLQPDPQELDAIRSLLDPSDTVELSIVHPARTSNLSLVLTQLHLGSRVYRTTKLLRELIDSLQHDFNYPSPVEESVTCSYQVMHEVADLYGGSAFPTLNDALRAVQQL